MAKIMEKVKLGTQGAVVSRMGLGCMGMSEFYGERNDVESAATLLRSLELGMDFLDTADAYGIGDNEELIGKTLRGRRDDVFLATKFANVRKKEDPMNWQISGGRNMCARRATLRSSGWEWTTLICTTSIGWTRRFRLRRRWARWRSW